jgi:hypothetical protein
MITFRVAGGILNVTGFPRGAQGRIEAALKGQYPLPYGMPRGAGRPDVGDYTASLAELKAIVRGVLTEADGTVVFQDDVQGFNFDRVFL